MNSGQRCQQKKLDIPTSLINNDANPCGRNFQISSKNYSKLSIKRHPVLLNHLVWIFPRSLYQTTRSISEKNDRTVLFQGHHSQILVSIKQPGLDIWKNSLAHNQ